MGLEPARSLAGRVAVVTGAGRGLGRAYALGLARAGAAVVVNDVDADVAEETVGLITADGGVAVVEVGAVGPAEVADRLVDRAVTAFGGLDVLCANAGVLRDRSLISASDEDFDEVVAGHLRGSFTCGRAAMLRFREQGRGGRLILAGSPAGLRGSYGQSAYSAAKAGIVGMMRTWAMEGERIGVTANAVIPRAVTRMSATVLPLRALTRQVARGAAVPPRVRARGLGMPDDVAPVVVFLASDAAAGVTGQCVAAGGDRISLWSHPTEVVAVVRAGGWTAEAVADVFPATFESALQEFRDTARMVDLPGRPGADGPAEERT
nr:SDR family oxidoreductase [Micromonospora sp. DSM 115978]